MAAIKSTETLKAEYFSWNQQVSDAAAAVRNTDMNQRKESFPEVLEQAQGIHSTWHPDSLNLSRFTH